MQVARAPGQTACKLQAAKGRRRSLEPDVSPVIDEVGMVMFARYMLQRKILPRSIIKKLLTFVSTQI